MISQCLIRGNGETEGVRSIQQAKPLTEQSALMLLSGLEPINTKGKNPKHTKKKKTRAGEQTAEEEACWENTTRSWEITGNCPEAVHNRQITLCVTLLSCHPHPTTSAIPCSSWQPRHSPRWVLAWFATSLGGGKNIPSPVEGALTHLLIAWKDEEAERVPWKAQDQHPQQVKPVGVGHSSLNQQVLPQLWVNWLTEMLFCRRGKARCCSIFGTLLYSTAKEGGAQLGCEEFSGKWN